MVSRKAIRQGIRHSGYLSLSTGILIASETTDGSHRRSMRLRHRSPRAMGARFAAESQSVQVPLSSLRGRTPGTRLHCRGFALPGRPVEASHARGVEESALAGSTAGGPLLGRRGRIPAGLRPQQETAVIETCPAGVTTSPTTPDGANGARRGKPRYAGQFVDHPMCIPHLFLQRPCCWSR